MKTVTLMLAAMFLMALTAGAIPSRPVSLPAPVSRRVKRRRGRK